MVEGIERKRELDDRESLDLGWADVTVIRRRIHVGVNKRDK